MSWQPQVYIFRLAWFTKSISCVYKLSSCNLGVRTNVGSVRMICQKLYVCLFITLHKSLISSFFFICSLTVLCRQCKGQGSCDVSVPGQCVQYYRCQKVENNWYVEKMNCAHGTHFSEATGGCIQPKDANCPYGNLSSICAYCVHFTDLIALEIN